MSRTGNDDLTFDCDHGAQIAVWRDAEHWRIGPRGDATKSPLLHHVLELAAGGERAAIAWWLLLRAEFGPEGIAELQAMVRANKEPCGGEWDELTPLFARLATQYPREIASMFPRAVSNEVLPLCGEHGIAAGLRAIASEDWWERQTGSMWIAELAERGVDLPIDKVHAAAAKETNVDTRPNFEDALQALMFTRSFGAKR